MKLRFTTSILALTLSILLVPTIPAAHAQETVPEPGDKTSVEVGQIMVGMAGLHQEKSGEAPDATMMLAGPIKSGMFRGADAYHKGSGQATIFRFADGSLELRLESFNVTSGPELHVLLVEHSNPATRRDLEAQGYVDLGKLRDSRGDQNYEIPGSVDVAVQRSVVIYCKPFHVIFSVAPLQDASEQ